jgi:hypothetical protein
LPVRPMRFDEQNLASISSVRHFATGPWNDRRSHIRGERTTWWQFGLVTMRRSPAESISRHPQPARNLSIRTSARSQASHRNRTGC